MPNVSIIIPVYNTEKYLRRCLDSVCNQTLSNIEIICINDCSTDNSLEILREYSAQDERIKVIDFKENKGVSVVRNAGIDETQGEYIGFVDSDDFVDLDFYEKLFEKASKTNADITKGEARIIGYNGKETFENQNQKIRENNSKLFFNSYWWTAIYKSSLIKNNKIKFLDNYPLGEDVLFLNQICLKANSIELIDGIYYNYFRNENSSDAKFLTLEKIESVLNIHEMIIDNTNNNIDSLDKNGVLNIYNWCITCGLNYLYRRKTIESLKLSINKTFDMYKKCKYKNELINILKTNFFIESYYLQTEDRLSMLDFFIKNDTPQKRIAAELRIKHCTKINKKEDNG